MAPLGAFYAVNSALEIANPFRNCQNPNMTPIAFEDKDSVILTSAQEQLFWDQRGDPPDLNSPRFILRVMEMGTWEMVEAMERAFSEDHLASALRAAPHGALSPRSWNFWCLRLKVDLPYPPRFPDQ